MRDFDNNSYIKTDENKTTLEIGLPGYAKEDVKVSSKNDEFLGRHYSYICINAKNEDRGEYNTKYRLFGDITLYDISCKMSNGLLKITLTKKQSEKDKERIINIE